MIIEHDTEELQKMEMERQRIFAEFKKALRLFNNSPAHKTIDHIRETIGDIDIEDLKQRLTGK